MPVTLFPTWPERGLRLDLSASSLPGLLAALTYIDMQANVCVCVCLFRLIAAYAKIMK